MTYTQVDDTLMDSPAFLTVSRSARLLLMEAYTYGNRHLTDGFITRNQWLRSTDSEQFGAEVDELMAADVIQRAEVNGAAGYQLDWSKQQTRETVIKGRERRRADNDRRVKSLEMHKAGDHSLCTHEGGGRNKRSESIRPSDGPSGGRKGAVSSIRPSDGPSGGRPLVGSPTHPIPTHPIPSHSGTEGWVGGGRPGSDSAKATSGLAGAAESPQSSAARSALDERWARADAIVADLFPDEYVTVDAAGGHG